MSHPDALPPPAFARTSLPANAQRNGVYVVLQGVSGADPLMGGWAYLQVEPDGVTHEAMDLNSMGGGDADLGCAVVAPLDGTVTFAQWWDGVSTGFGNHVAVWIDDPRAAPPCYLHVAHLATIVVREGERVVAGQLLGTCGKSGWQPYAHCHTAHWYDVPPGGWNFWQSPGWQYPRDWVASVTLDPEAWFWASVTNAGGMPPPEMVAMLEDWQVKGWILAPLYQEAALPYNPDSGTAQAWVDRLRDGHYVGRPRSPEQPYGEGDEAGVWVEFERGACLYRLRDGAVSWNG